MSDCVCDKKNFKTCVWHRARMPDMEKREYIEALEKSNKELQKERDELKGKYEKMCVSVFICCIPDVEPQDPDILEMWKHGKFLSEVSE